MLHEAIRENAMSAYDALGRGESNPLARLLADDERIVHYVDPAEVRAQLDPTGHIGDAPARARRLAQRVRTTPGGQRPVNKGREIARGKTKILYEADANPDLLVVQQMDAITAGDGARRDVIEGKGRIAAKTTARVFRLLNLCGLPTHYISGGEDDDNNEMLVRRAQMIPLEVVVRGVAAGSFVKRRPGVARGSILVPRVIEFFLKDDANHDPLIEPDEIVARGIATPQELGTMSELARITFEIFAHAWRRRDTLLVDLKIEFGRLDPARGRASS